MPAMPRAGLQLLFPFLLLLAFFFPNFSSAISSKLLPSPPNSKSICWARCHRLLQRNMDRLEQSLTVEEVLYRIGAFRKAQLLAHGTTEDHISSTSSSSSSEELALPSEQFKDICWKFFDFEDCQKQCQKVFSKGRRKKRRGGRPRPKDFAVTQPEHRLVLHFCRRTDFAIPQQFACVHKFHSFLEVHCSTYQHRAVQLRLIALQLEQTDIDARKFGGAEELGRLRKAIDQELCLLLHQHQACLVNSGLRFCPPQSSAPSHKPTAADVSPFSTSNSTGCKVEQHEIVSIHQCN